MTRHTESRFMYKVLRQYPISVTKDRFKEFVKLLHGSMCNVFVSEKLA